MITTYNTIAQKPKIGKIISNDPSLSTLLDNNDQLEVLGEGFEWSEGPVWVKDGNYLLFSDVPTNIIYKWKESEKIESIGHTVYSVKKGKCVKNNISFEFKPGNNRYEVRWK